MSNYANLLVAFIIFLNSTQTICSIDFYKLDSWFSNSSLRHLDQLLVSFVGGNELKWGAY